MLTIVGYSINATIVIFDRIRENMHGSRRIDNIEEVVNSSITQTLTRSIYTSFTTFVMVAVLYIMGVSSIREFAAPLMVGILVGALFFCLRTGALWLVMKKNIKKKKVSRLLQMTATGKNFWYIPLFKKKNKRCIPERSCSAEKEK